jgi:nucleoside-diphosphate-sugar epimerase
MSFAGRVGPVSGGHVLVTGGAGFVGRWLVQSLLDDDADVWVVDDLSTGLDPDAWRLRLKEESTTVGGTRTYRHRSSRLVFIEADASAFFGARLRISGFDSALDSIPLPHFDEAYHLASVVGGRKKIEEQPLRVGIDLSIDSLFALWMAETAPADRMLYASSSAAYPVEHQGDEGAIALDERLIDFKKGDISMPDMTYGWSKLTGEYLTFLLAKHHGLRCCAIRPFSGYGEDQDLTYPVPAIARRAALYEDPLVVWGSGRQGRDFVHISDCIRAMRLAIERIEDGSGVNIASGELMDFLTVARLLADLAGYNPEIRGTDNRPVGVHARFASVRLARDRLGFEPRVSLREGLERVLRYQQAQAGLRPSS